MELNLNERGFPTGYFEDKNGTKCSIQESSIATERCIWLGIHEANPQIMTSDAIKIGAITMEQAVRLREKGEGWTPFHVPSEVLISTRMHLTQEQVAELLPILQRFVETGELEKV